jgi:excisionase family DNA binding protein
MTAHPESFNLIQSARLLGVSKWTIYRLIKHGKLAAFTIDGRTEKRGKRFLRIHLSELRRYKRDQMLAVDVDPPR